MNAPATVLIVDHSAESRQVLRALLERLGTRAIEAGEAKEALRLAAIDPPDLVVIDWDTYPGQPAAEYGNLDAAFGCKNTPILVIGSIQRQYGQVPRNRTITKPYHYRDLLRKIEQMLGNAA